VVQADLIAGQLRDDPDNADLRILLSEVQELIDHFNQDIAALKPQTKPKETTTAPAAAPEPEKWSRENHPAFKKNANPTEDKDKDKDDAPVNYQVNDTVLAKWVSGDKAFYTARITSITGSSTAPIYTVKFKSYDETETLRSKDIRPVSNKRKADDVSSAPAPVAAPAPGVVSSAGATVYPDAKKTADKQDDPSKPPKPKKIKAKKELEAGKNKWQEFNSKSKFGKTQKKDSMFRTPEGINGRVGFTGSGQAMRKDPTRSRHVYQVNEDAE
jgi:survival-of-motor-neuron-related-splicing factor 30